MSIILKKNIILFFVSYISIFIFSFFLNHDLVNIEYSFELLLQSSLTSLILWYSLYITSYNRVSYYLMVLFLSILLTIKIYYNFFLGISIEPSIFEGMINTNLHEVKQLGSYKPLYIFIIVILYLTIIIEFTWFNSFRFRHKVLVHFSKIVVFFLILLIYSFSTQTVQVNSSLITRTFPINFFMDLYKAADTHYNLYILNSSKIDLTKKYHFTVENNDDLIMIFIRAGFNYC